MAQIVPQFDLAANIGKSLGEGLTKGLNTLAQIKLQDVMRRQNESRVGEAYEKAGLPRSWSTFPEPTQRALMKSLLQEHPEILERLSGLKTQGNVFGNQTSQPSPEQEMVGQLNNMFSQPQTIDNALQGQIGIGRPNVGEGANTLRQMANKGWSNPQQNTADQQNFGQINPDQLGFNTRTYKGRQEFSKYAAGEQRRIDAKYKKYNENVDKEQALAHIIKTKAEQALELLATHKTRSGAMGLLPSAATLANKETRELEKLYEEIAYQKAQEGTGIMSKMKIQAAKATKPSLNMPLEAQEFLLKDIINENERRGIALGDIRDRILEANGGKIPENLTSLINKEYYRKFPINGKNNNFQQSNKPAENQEEDFIDQLGRVGATAATKVGQGAVTGLGNIAKAGAGLIDYGAEKVGLKPELSKYAAKLPLPTSQSVSDRLSKWTNGFTDPRSSAEEFIYDIAELFGSMFMPGAAVGKVASGLGKLGMGIEKASKIAKYMLPFSGSTATPARMLAAATAGTTAKSAAENLGLGPVPQVLMQGAAMLATGTAGTRAKLGKEAESLFNKAEKGFENLKTDSRYTMDHLTRIKNDAVRTGHPYAKEIGEVVDDVVNGIKKSQKTNIVSKVTNKLSGATKKTKVTTYDHKVTDLIDSAKNINSRYGWSTHQRIPGGKFTPKEMRPELGRIIKVIDEGVARASKVSPTAEQAARDYFTGKDLYKALNTHGDVTKFFIDNADLSGAFAGHGNAVSTIFNIIKGTASYAARDIAKAQSLFRQPVGRAAYFNALKSAANNDRNGFIKAMNVFAKIDKSIG